jgi:cytidylate kinase
MIIALDGPSAAGKGTLARRLAAHYGLAHLDTGSLYRAVGGRVLRAGGDPAEAAQAVAAAAALTEADRMASDLRTEAVGQAASKVAAIPEVRVKLLDYQRNFARHPSGAILDGRDIGTVICPDADVKLFLTASLEARADRRFRELQAAGAAPIRHAVLEEMTLRDRRDSERQAAPLKPARDAFVLDTSALDADAVFAAAVEHISERMRSRRA